MNIFQKNMDSETSLREVYYNDNDVFEQVFVPYLKWVAKVPEIVIEEWRENIDYCNDYQLMKMLRNRSPSFEHSKQSYSKKSNKTAWKLVDVLREAGISGISSYLDIGAIEDTQILAMSRALRINKNRCYGINVDEFAEGSITYGQKKGSRVTIYDGTNIPIINGIKQYDLITILSTLHHIPSPKLEELMISIGQRCKKYVLIKENNLDTDNAKIYMNWQHKLFGRRDTLETYTRFDLTFNRLVEMFESVGFELLHRTEVNYFAKSEYIVFKKRDYNTW